MIEIVSISYKIYFSTFSHKTIIQVDDSVHTICTYSAYKASKSVHHVSGGASEHSHWDDLPAVCVFSMSECDWGM